MKIPGFSVEKLHGNFNILVSINVERLSSSMFLQIMKQERWKEVTFELPKYSRISQYAKFACSSAKFISILPITPFKLG